MSRKVLLIIMDGWGIGDKTKSDAIWNANTPFTKRLNNTNFSILSASGEDVGLPEGQMGNSEVGHLNIGAGKIVYQDFVRINRAIKDGSIKKNKVLNDAFNYAKVNGKNVHLMGLVSDGGVHSSMEHLYALCDYAEEIGLSKVFVHAFMDGRDTDPHSGIKYIRQLNEHIKNSSGQVATICGRYYAMDRDKRWERVKLAYDAMVNGVGEITKNPVEAIEKSYAEGVTDEFLKPIIVSENNNLPTAKIEENDVVFCFNFRTDRGREITEVLSQQDFPDFGMKKLNLYYVTLTNYDESFQNVKVIFDEEVLQETMGEVLERAGRTQIRIAETEKYPHVTFFFSGGREKEFVGERRLLCPSPKDVATYDLKPEMSAFDIRDTILPELEKESADFICLNFANADMVGHTGVFEAAVKACEAVDKCIEAVATTAYEHGYAVFILADHGNSDYMINPDGSPNTQHSTNLVPLIVMDKDQTWNLKPGKLGDVAPSILKVMGVEIPEIMTGEVLVS